MRYPLEPLFKLTGWSMHDVTKLLPCNSHEYRARREHGLTELHADRAAIAAGLPPALIWPHYADEQAKAVSRPCIECGELFIPHNAAHLCCELRCTYRRGERLRYQTDPEYRAWKLAKAAEYRAETRESRRKKDAQYREKNREKIAARERARYAARRQRQPEQDQQVG